MKAGFQLLASDRMEGKGPIETKSSRSSCDSLMENSNRLLVMQSVHKYLKAASESEASLDDVIVELRDELADALECFSSFLLSGNLEDIPISSSF